MIYIPYETYSRVEAEELGRSLPSSLDNLSDQQKSDLLELFAGAFARGIDAGFAMSDFAGHDPATSLEIYNAGFAQGKLEGENKWQ